jgi:hypothetical protein
VGLVTLLTLVFLVAMWVAVLAAPVLQGRGSSKGGDSIRNFQKQLAVLERGAPHRGGPSRAGASRPAAAARRPVSQSLRASQPGPARPEVPRGIGGGRVAAPRRRRVVIILVAAVVTTAVGGWMFGGWFWALNLIADGLLVAYVAVAVRVVRSTAELEMKVAFLPHRESGAEPTALLRDAVRNAR